MCPGRVANFQCGEFSFPSDTENNYNVLFLSVPVNSPQLQLNLTLSRWRPLSYRNQCNDLLPKSMDWFLCDTASVLKGLNPNQNDINSPYIPFHNESSRWFKKRPLEHSNQIMNIKQFSRIFYYCSLNKSPSTEQFVSTVSNLLQEFQHAEILFVKSFISLCVRVSVDVCVYTLPMLKLLSFAMPFEILECKDQRSCLVGIILDDSANIAQKIRFSIKDLFSKCDHILGI